MNEKNSFGCQNENENVKMYMRTRPVKLDNGHYNSATNTQNNVKKQIVPNCYNEFKQPQHNSISLDLVGQDQRTHRG